MQRQKESFPRDRLCDLCVYGVSRAVSVSAGPSDLLQSVSEAAVVTFSLPEKFLWENFAYVIEKGQLLRAFKNSLIITGSAVTLTVFVASITAFVLTRRSDRLSRILSNYFLIGMIAPLSLIPEVMIVKF